MSKENYIPRLLELYNSEIQENLKKELNLDNIMRVPKLKKISLNIGLGDGKLNKNGMNQAVEELSIISGQKAVLTYAKKAISNFKIRKGDPVVIISDPSKIKEQLNWETKIDFESLIAMCVDFKLSKTS